MASMERDKKWFNDGKVSNIANTNISATIALRCWELFSFSLSPTLSPPSHLPLSPSLSRACSSAPSLFACHFPLSIPHCHLHFSHLPLTCLFMKRQSCFTLARRPFACLFSCRCLTSPPPVLDHAVHLLYHADHCYICDSSRCPFSVQGFCT